MLRDYVVLAENLCCLVCFVGLAVHVYLLPPSQKLKDHVKQKAPRAPQKKTKLFVVPRKIY
jgi:hypothetical protein